MTGAKSKEEITEYRFFQLDEGGPEALYLKDAHKSMDEYAEQESISFAEWIANNNIQRIEITKGLWNWMVPRKYTPGVLTTFPDFDHYTTFELYSLYLKSK